MRAKEIFLAFSLLTPESTSGFSLVGRGCCLMRLDGRIKPGGRSGIAGLPPLSFGDTCTFVMLLSDFLRNSIPSSVKELNIIHILIVLR